MSKKTLPTATVTRIARDETGLRIGADAKKELVTATELFLRELATEASSHEFFDGKKTIQARDIEHILDKRYKRMIPKPDAVKPDGATQ